MKPVLERGAYTGSLKSPYEASVRGGRIQAH